MAAAPHFIRIATWGEGRTKSFHKALWMIYPHSLSLFISQSSVEQEVGPRERHKA